MPPKSGPSPWDPLPSPSTSRENLRVSLTLRGLLTMGARSFWGSTGPRRHGQHLAVHLLRLHGRPRRLLRDEPHSWCPQRVSESRAWLNDLEHCVVHSSSYLQRTGMQTFQSLISVEPGVLAVPNQLIHVIPFLFSTRFSFGSFKLSPIILPYFFLFLPLSVRRP